MMNKKHLWYIVYLVALVVGFVWSAQSQKPVVPEKYKNYVFPYHDYTMAMYGDIPLYEKVVKERQEKTPSHPDYFDLSIEVARRTGYAPAYYNAYRALRDLYEYNHFEMGDNVKRLMYGYLQLAIEKEDKRITEKDLKDFNSAYHVP